MTHVLAVRLDNDGDVLLAGQQLGVDELLVWRAPWIDPEPEPLVPGAIEALAARLAALGLDAAVIFGSFHQSPLPTALVLRMAGVPFVAAASVDYPGALLDVRHRISDDVHEVERSLDLAAAAGFPLPAGDDGALRIRRPARPPAPARDERAVVVHPGASVPARAWAPERNAALVQALADAGRRVLVTGGPSERTLTARVAGPARPEVVDLGGRTSLAGLAEVLAGAACVVVGNTGPAHLAAAVGTPVVSLFAPTVPPVRWRPWRVPHELLFVDVPCAGCRARACPIEGHPCLDGVAVEEAVGAVGRLAPAGVPA